MLVGVLAKTNLARDSALTGGGVDGESSDVEAGEQGGNLGRVGTTGGIEITNGGYGGSADVEEIDNCFGGIEGYVVGEHESTIGSEGADVDCFSGDGDIVE